MYPLSIFSEFTMTLHPALRFGLKSLAFLAKATLVLACVSIWLAFVVFGIICDSDRAMRDRNSNRFYSG